MSYRELRLSPQASTHVIRMRIAVEDASSSLLLGSPDTGFLRSSLEYDSDLEMPGSRGINWGAISGLALSVAVSASFWAGVVWVVARVWR